MLFFSIVLSNIFLISCDAIWALGRVQEITKSTLFCSIDEGPQCYGGPDVMTLEPHTYIEDITNLFGVKWISYIPRSDGWRLIRLCRSDNITGWVAADDLHFLGRGYDCPDVDGLPNLSDSWKRQKYGETFKLYHSLIQSPKIIRCPPPNDEKPCTEMYLHVHTGTFDAKKYYGEIDDGDL